MVERQSLNRLAETGARPSRIVRPGSGQVRSPRGLESFRATADSSEKRRNHRGDDCATQAEPAGAGRQDGQRIEGVPNHGTTRASRPMRSRGSYQVFGTDSLTGRRGLAGCISAEVEVAIFAHALNHPTHGALRVAQECPPRACGSLAAECAVRDRHMRCRPSRNVCSGQRGPTAEHRIERSHGNHPA